MVHLDQSSGVGVPGSVPGLSVLPQHSREEDDRGEAGRVFRQRVRDAIRHANSVPNEEAWCSEGAARACPRADGGLLAYERPSTSFGGAASSRHR